MLSLHARTRDADRQEEASSGPGRRRDGAWAWGCPVPTPMRTLRVVILDELGEHRPEVPLVQDHQVIEALGPEGPHDFAPRIAFAGNCPIARQQ
jgi:hypothetical protein